MSDEASSVEVCPSSLSLSLSRLLEYMSTLTYIRTCTVIHMSTCFHAALLGLEPPPVASLQ